ncbi:CLUMA_CG013487, isoform A [Clunio marinus]|uniref:CLUMA_CG013487, isoform A n=1 Tax=Clunio marinus TaxID=568069 RepID=A0A1J1IIZ8_9DIPT|nr:CLUMA_CG013487, isoform A [Clunio marinus]
MAEVPTIETRSRSRSKTPGLLASENGDHGKKGSKKIPTISLIEEEDDAVEIVPISQDTRPKRQRRNAKAVTSDTSGDVSEDSLKNSQKKNVIKSVTVESVSVVKTTNGNEESSEQVTTSVKSTSNEGSDALENQSIFNNIFTAIKTSTPILSNKSSKRVTQNAINSDVNAADHPAYKLYIEAGEYWNQYPKTDYTYSELSPHRRELSNGIVAMPNMSRRSLEKYHTRVENMIQKNPTEEGFLRRKFLSNANTSFQKRSADLQYDSADEIDVSKFRNSYQVRKQENFMSRFVSMIRSMFVSLYDRTSQAFSLSRGRRSYYPVRKQPGIFYKAFESLKKFLLLTFSKIYLLISSILCLDTWIVYNRSNNTMENRRRKRFMLTMLVLLPLLVLSGKLRESFKRELKIKV